MTMTTRRARAVPVAVALAVATALAACGGDEGGDREDASTAAGSGGDVDLALGEQAYADSCARCHGADLRGTDQGPSHLSVVYEPGHHPDTSFEAAIREGTRQHHWEFGDMPPVEGLDDAEVEAVITYIRSVQAAEGFEPYPPA